MPRTLLLRDILLRTRLPPDIRVAIARIIREHTSPALEREGRRQPLPRHDDPQSATQVDWQNVTVPLNSGVAAVTGGAGATRQRRPSRQTRSFSDSAGCHHQGYKGFQRQSELGH